MELNKLSLLSEAKFYTVELKIRNFDSNICEILAPIGGYSNLIEGEPYNIFARKIKTTKSGM